jgi:hypothetical protein
MTKHVRIGIALLVAINVLAWGMLGFYRTTGAAPTEPQLPFRNAVEQRQEMIRELQEIKILLKEQNALLRTGSAKAEPAGKR